MTRRMLINAVHPEECRIAIAEDDHLFELEIERADQIQLKGNVYKSTITRIEPSLQAAFLDIGSNRNGFLQINDIHPAYFKDWPPEGVTGRLPRPFIQDVLRAGQNLVVQVVKDEREMKGATLTTNLSLPGRYLVLMIGNQRGGVSRKIIDAGQRSRLRQVVHKLRVPPGASVIVRTAGINKTSAELQADLDNLLTVWQSIVQKAGEPSATPVVLYQESDLSIRTIRDYLTSDIDEVLIDDEAMYQRALAFVENHMPLFANRLKFYAEPRPLFSNFMLDSQLEATDSSEVTLPSGGSIVIDVTEAIVAIDVNSGRATSQADVEGTAFKTNKEAAYEIAKQLRLRDLGGLVVIDFIDMLDKRHKQSVEKALKDAVRYDKAKVELSRISKFGLMEMSRQRMKASLSSQNYLKCPHCVGRGKVKTPDAAALDALRKIESAVCAGGVVAVRIRLAPAAALFLLNNKRRVLSKIEEERNISILVYADGRIKQHEYELELVTGGQRESSVVSNITVTPPTRAGSAERDPQRRDRRSDSDRGRNQGGRGGRRGGRGADSGRGRRGGGRGGRGRSDDRRSDDRRSDDRRGDNRRGDDRRSDDRRTDDRGGRRDDDRQTDDRNNQRSDNRNRRRSDDRSSSGSQSSNRNYSRNNEARANSRENEPRPVTTKATTTESSDEPKRTPPLEG